MDSSSLSQSTPSMRQRIRQWFAVHERRGATVQHAYVDDAGPPWMLRRGELRR
jgi:hypothetical protein